MMRYLGYVVLSLAGGALAAGGIVGLAAFMGAYPKGGTPAAPVCRCGNPNCVKARRS